MIKMVEVAQTGGPEVMQIVERDLPSPKAGEIRVRNRAIGVNFIDIYFRSGLYPAPHSPFILGKEGAGVVEAVGEGVETFKIGDRVAYANAQGSYAEAINIPASQLVIIHSDKISDDIAASIMLKGMTARYLLKDSYQVKQGPHHAERAAEAGRPGRRDPPPAAHARHLRGRAPGARRRRPLALGLSRCAVGVQDEHGAAVLGRGAPRAGVRKVDGSHGKKIQ